MDLQSVNIFLDRVHKMQVGRSKEMRLTYDEAFKLSLAIAQLMAKKLEHVKESEPTQIIINGGSLKPS